jgi:hypothetical protein
MRKDCWELAKVEMDVAVKDVELTVMIFKEPEVISSIF